MHILMLSDVYFPRVNGVSTSIQSFRNALRNEGHKVTLIAPDYKNNSKNNSDKCDKKEEVDIIRVNSRSVPLDPEDRFMRYKDVINTFETLKNSGIDIVHIQTPFIAHYAGVKLARMLDVPFIVSYHTYFEEYLFHYIPFAPKFIMKYFARRFTRSQCNEANAIISPSPAMANVLQQYGIIQPIKILPTGLDLSKFQGGHRLAFRQSLKLDTEQPTLVFLGRVAHEKNIDFLLYVLRDLVPQHRDIKLIIAGEGPAEAHLKQIAHKLHITEHVIFKGYLDRETELLDCYRAGDIFVFASQTETQGLVLIEAMAMGLPVVAISAMGTKSILDAQQGALIAKHNVQDFSEKISYLINNPTQRNLLSQQGRQYAKHWSIERCCASLIDLYKRTIHDSKASSVHNQAVSEHNC